MTIARTAAKLVALALAATIVVAWACAVWWPEPGRVSVRDLDAPPITGAPGAWGVPVVSEQGVHPGFASYEESWALVLFEGQDDLVTPQEAMALRRSDDVPIGALSETLLVTTRRSLAGLPFRCLQWRTCEVPIDVEMPPGFRDPYTTLDRGLLGLDNFVGYVIMARRGRRLPIVPVWPALLANTAVYAAALGGVLYFLPAARRASRRSRGLCPRCAYPVGVSSTCTECGAPIRAPRPNRARDPEQPAA